MSSSELIKQSNTPSTALASLIQKAAMNFKDFAANWNEIKIVGFQEGFTDQQLVNMVKEQLKALGLPSKQINNKIFYLKHIDEERVRNKKKYERNKVSTGNQYNEESGFTDNRSLIEENEQLRRKNEELEDKLLNVGFSDNPDVFCIRKDSETFFPKVSVIEARSLLSGIGDGTTKINLAWEIVQQ